MSMSQITLYSMTISPSSPRHFAVHPLFFLIPVRVLVLSDSYAHETQPHLPTVAYPLGISMQSAASMYNPLMHMDDQG